MGEKYQSIFHLPRPSSATAVIILVIILFKQQKLIQEQILENSVTGVVYQCLSVSVSRIGCFENHPWVSEEPFHESIKQKVSKKIKMYHVPEISVLAASLCFQLFTLCQQFHFLLVSTFQKLLSLLCK